MHNPHIIIWILTLYVWNKKKKGKKLAKNGDAFIVEQKKNFWNEMNQVECAHHHHHWLLSNNPVIRSEEKKSRVSSYKVLFNNHGIEMKKSAVKKKITVS